MDKKENIAVVLRISAELISKFRIERKLSDSEMRRLRHYLFLLRDFLDMVINDDLNTKEL